MATTRVLSQTEKERVFATVVPYGEFEAPHRTTSQGVQPIKWEDKLGNLNEWREHQGMGRAIMPVLASAAKTTAVRNSIGNRLLRLHPNESWTTYVNGKFLFLKFNGAKRTRARNGNSNGNPVSELFSQSA